ncbi:MAG: FAD-binding oxidoreductase [Actinomycetia bacterium]|nr:FAD-binding oxidoreductase [Actinomycetes bacterium]MCP4958563.1 FAD-binding oxidoreductase [Actinomycetes bacterium]
MTHIDRTPNYDRSNGWLELLPPLAPPSVLTGEIGADHVVIGGGYSGLAVARRLAELDRSASIVLIEGDRIGNNAAGRSSGFAIDHAHNLRAKGFADAVRAAKAAIELNRAGLDWLGETIEANRIDCQWVQEGKFHAAATKRGERMLDSFAASLDAIDEDYTRLGTGECADTFGTTYYSKAIHAPHSYLVQPAAMVRGLADTMPANVSVFEDSMVTDVDFGPPHTIRTTRGTVRTPSLVLANNGWVEGFGFLHRHLIPLITWGSITRELTEAESDSVGGAASYGVIAAHPAGTSVRRVTTPNNRIVVRNIFSFSRRSDFVTHKNWASRTHRKAFERRWPGLADVPFEHTWGGALSLSRNGEPVFGKMRPGVHGTVVHNGVGIARGTIGGKLLAEMILGGDSDLLSQMLAKGRPNAKLPFQDLGVRINARARRIIAGREE